MRQPRREQGFVLITTLVVLLILTIMAIGLYFRSVVNQQGSVADRDATKAYYLAETALNYMAFALHSDPANSSVNNDLNLDGDTAPATGDRTELASNPDQKSTHSLGYFDITPLASRAINFNSYTNPPSVTLATFAPPAHVTLDITTNDATNTVSITPSWNGGNGTPAKDGAIVWITSGVLDEGNPANEIDSDDTSADYAVIAYAIGYVNGQPKRLLRAKIGKVEAGFPSSLGSVTNGYQ